MTIAEGLLRDLAPEFANTRRMLERVPDTTLAYLPHPKSMTMAQLVGHICDVPHWGALTAQLRELDYAPVGGKALEQCVADTVGAALSHFDAGVELAQKAIGQLDDQAMLADWTLLKAGTPLFTMPRIQVFKTMVLAHTIHHRAQLGVYLRMNDVPIPGMYGPSADDR